MRELDRRGERKHEAGVFLLGLAGEGRRVATHAIYYDELDPNAYSTGVCVLYADAFAKLWTLCREAGLTVVADIHTHGGRAIQSISDKNNPMVARAGHIALIIPNMAAAPVPMEQIGIYEYRGNHQWFDRSPRVTRGYLYMGFWS
ncbi:MAG: hypothetical protein CVT83_01190 [Alphaproteobacteria bacterium HGW-Alphaproteobacteria-5]|nr:MAG: hypothetical protein CVT83_01190 [Alphaproteobacteria bacterium HGW-Alphaproteobacteria-5]